MKLSLVFVTSLLAGGVMGLFSCDKPHAAQNSEPNWAELRREMVMKQIKARGVRDPDVIRAMLTVPRHKFVPRSWRYQAYNDCPLPIGSGQTISQPYIVALMTELLDVHAGDKVLEIGTGSGYQAAVLAEMGVKVYTIEIIPELCKKARATLDELGYTSVETRCGDGYGGWPEAAPFDGIIVTAAPSRIPEPLLQQLAPGAHMVIPVGSYYQELKVLTKKENGEIVERSVIPVRFVPMTGKIQRGGEEGGE